MAYTATYAATDLGAIIVDFVGGIFARLAAQSGTVGDYMVLALILGLILLVLDKLFGILGGVTGNRLLGLKR